MAFEESGKYVKDAGELEKGFRGVRKYTKDGKPLNEPVDKIEREVGVKEKTQEQLDDELFVTEYIDDLSINIKSNVGDKTVDYSTLVDRPVSKGLHDALARVLRRKLGNEYHVTHSIVSSNSEKRDEVLISKR